MISAVFRLATGHVLAAGLNSVVRQTLPADEVIVDAGSTDLSADIAVSFGSPLKPLRRGQ
jgi:hypothetical protein